MGLPGILPPSRWQAADTPQPWSLRTRPACQDGVVTGVVLSARPDSTVPGFSKPTPLQVFGHKLWVITGLLPNGDTVYGFTLQGHGPLQSGLGGFDRNGQTLTLSDEMVRQIRQRLASSPSPLIAKASGKTGASVQTNGQTPGLAVGTSVDAKDRTIAAYGEARLDGGTVKPSVTYDTGEGTHVFGLDATIKDDGNTFGASAKIGAGAFKGEFSGKDSHVESKIGFTYDGSLKPRNTYAYMTKGKTPFFKVSVTFTPFADTKVKDGGKPTADNRFVNVSITCLLQQTFEHLFKRKHPPKLPVRPF